MGIISIISSIIGIILLWVVIVTILGGLGFIGLSYKLLRKIYKELCKTDDEDKSE